MPKTLVMFIPMIVSPPAHPDTVITTLVNLERALNTGGMQYTNIIVDLQLYQTACLVQWNDPLRWTNVILHPGMMHTLMSFLGCIGTLKKAYGVDILISATFAGITSIVNEKADIRVHLPVSPHWHAGEGATSVAHTSSGSGHNCSDLLRRSMAALP